MQTHNVQSQPVERGEGAAPATDQHQASNSLLDQTRRLAVRRCILTCLTNGWAPPADSVWRLVALRESWLRGERSEDVADKEGLARLAFYRWLFQQGRLSETDR